MVRKIQPSWEWYGNYSFDDHFERFAQIDKNAVLQLLGVDPETKFEPNGEPIGIIFGLLFKYGVDVIGDMKPAFPNRMALLKELERRAKSLSSGFERTGSQSYEDIERSLSRSVDQPYAHIMSDDEVCEEVEFFRKFCEDIERFSAILETARTAFETDPEAPAKGRPPKTGLAGLILNLAKVFASFTSMHPYTGFTSNPVSGEYSSPFFSFVHEILSKYHPESVWSNNALGTQIRKVLAR